MAATTMGFGILLMGLGVGFFFGTDAHSATALIPAFFGLPILILGWLSRQEHLRKHTMHAAAALGLLGFLGGAVMGVLGYIKVASQSEGARPNAALESSIMGVVCAVFVGLCVKSFVDARRRRTQPLA